MKTIRDLDSAEVSHIIFDDEQVYSHVDHLIDNFTENARSKLILYAETSPIFDYYEVEIDISRALSLGEFGYLQVVIWL